MNRDFEKWIHRLARPAGANLGLENEPPSLSVAAGKSSGLGKISSLSVAEGKSLGLGKISSLSVAEGKSLGLGKISSLSVAEGKSLGIEKDSSLARPGVSGRKAGHSIVEYALPAMLVGLVAVGGFTALLNGDQFAQSGALSQFQGSSLTTDAQGRTLVNTRAMGQNPYLQRLSLVTDKGTRLTLSAFPSDLAAFIETDGGQGTTELLLANMDALIAQLVASGEMTEAEGNLIKGLSNKGYALSRDQQVLESVIRACGGQGKLCVQEAMAKNPAYSQAYMSLSFDTVETQFGDNRSHIKAVYSHEDPLSGLYVLSPSQLSLLNRWDQTLLREEASRVWLNNNPENLRVGKGVYDFLTTYESVQKTTAGSMSPQASSLLNYLSQQVLLTTNRTQYAAYLTSAQNAWLTTNSGRASGPGEFAEFVPETFNATLSQSLRPLLTESRSALTTALSGDICETGQGRVSEGGTPQCR